MVEIFCSRGSSRMNEDSKNYEMQILAMMINQYLDDMVSLSEEKLNQLEANRDQIVWDLATRIYKESGHKVEFHIIRNLINSRIEVMRYQLFFSKSSLLESKRIDEEKAMKIAEQKANAIINDKKIDDTKKITSQENEQALTNTFPIPIVNEYSSAKNTSGCIIFGNCTRGLFIFSTINLIIRGTPIANTIEISSCKLFK